MLPDEIGNKENIYRAIKKYPNWWDAEFNRPTSAAFKDSLGVSVDRQGDREHLDCVNTILNKFGDLKAVVSIETIKSIENGAKPVYDRTEDNDYHTLLKNLDLTIPLTSSTAKKLSRSVEVCFFSE